MYSIFNNPVSAELDRDVLFQRYKRKVKSTYLTCAEKLAGDQLNLPYVEKLNIKEKLKQKIKTIKRGPGGRYRQSGAVLW